MTDVERHEPDGQVEAANRLLTALESATSPHEVRLIFDRAEALVDAAKRARVADEQLRQYVAVSLRAQRRGGEILKVTPRSKGRPWHGLPTIADVMGLPPNKAKHVAENWIAVAEVPEHLFDDYLTRQGIVPSRAGLLRFSNRPKRSPGRPRADGTPPAPAAAPTPLHAVPDDAPTTRREQLDHPAFGRALPDPRAEGWQACIDYLRERVPGRSRIPDGVLQAAEAANPYTH